MSRFGGRHFGPPLAGVGVVATSWLASFLLDPQGAPHNNHGPSSLTATSTTRCQGAATASPPRLVFLGTGSSTGCPRPLCPLVFNKVATLTPELRALRKAMKDDCQTSNLALTGSPPKFNRNYRNNPSLLIQTETGHSVVIDVGKTFREGALRWLPDYGVTGLDAIVLTHEHMDAAAGLDDVRGFQAKGPPTKTGERPKNVATPIYLSQHCYEDLQERFPWLLPKPKAKSEATTTGVVVPRHVASFDVHVFQDYKAFTPVPGFDMIPLPVLHGEDLISYGYEFQLGDTRVVYLSDLSRMLPETLAFLKQGGPPDILIIDSLHPKQYNPVHYHMEDALALASELKAKQVYLVGMNCDSFLPHDEQNEELRKQYGNVQFAHDGLSLAC